MADITGKEIIKDILEKTIIDNHSSVLFGSDFGMCDINAHIELIDGLNISDKLKKAIYYQNALKLYHLEIAIPSNTI